jgi:GcrA cell cycle regulator
MQLTDLTAHPEPASDAVLEQIETPRVKAPMPPQFGQHCCYPIGEPRTPEFHYCTAPVAQRGAPYCLEHMRICHTARDVAA